MWAKLTGVAAMLALSITAFANSEEPSNETGVSEYAGTAIVNHTEATIEKVSVESISLNISILGVGYSQLTEYDPPADWSMGQYLGVIVNNTIETLIGSFDYLLESDAVHGPPPSGTVDTNLGTIALDLYSLNMTVTGLFTGDFHFFDPDTSVIESNDFNADTGDFVFGWADSAPIWFGELPLNLEFSVAVTGVASITTDPIAKPGKVKNLQASDGTKPKFVKLTWNKKKGAEKYRIYRAPKKSKPFEKIGKTTDVVYKDKSAEVGKKYFYRVKACNSEGCGKASDIDKGYR